MKRIYFFSLFLIGFAVISSAQSKGQIIDDVYLTPNDQSMIKKAEKVRRTAEPAVYRNGAREIVFIDQNGNRTNIVSDTVFVINNDTLMQVDNYEDGYYLNGFKGSQSDLEYAERIRRFHNPRYTIHISDPQYSDIYFLNNSDWNVYVDGSYAYVTPTWTNPYWWNYNYSPHSSWSWGLGWGSYWGRPYYGSYWGSYYGWGYGGYYDPWYSSYYPWYTGNYWGYGGYPYYGGYYGFGYGYPYYGGGYYGYPYYGGGYYYNNNTVDVSSRRRSTINNDRSVPDPTVNTNRRSAVIGERSSANPYTVVSRSRENQGNYDGSMSGVRRSADARGTGAVRSSGEWSNVRSSSEYSTRTERSSSVMTNRSNPSEIRRSDGYGTSPRSYDNSGSRSNGNNYPSRSSYESGSRSSGSYSTPSRSSSSYDGGSRSSSSSSSSSSSGSSRSSGSTSSNRR